MMRADAPITAESLLHDVRLLVILFISFRLLLLIVYQPMLLDGVERGLSAGGDQAYYFGLAALSAQGLYPFVDWWSEFPPVWSHLTVLVYQLGGDHYTGWMMVIAQIMLAFDLGILLLIRRIGGLLHGPATGAALAWVYALLAAPFVFLYWTFETIVAFWLLLGLWWLLRGRDHASAVAAAIGALVKFTPALLLGAVWRYRGPRRALIYMALTLGIFGAAYIPLLLRDAPMTLPSLAAQFNKASYQTVWALLDGNMTTGIFGDITDRLHPARAYVLNGRPAVVPGLVRLAAAALIGLAAFALTRRFDDEGLVAFVGLTLLIFFLQAQGWSPQWVVQIIPLMLLAFPTRTGVLLIVILSTLVFAEYPLLFIRTGDSGGQITGGLVVPFAALVIVRTLLLIGWSAMLFGRLRQPSSN